MEGVNLAHFIEDTNDLSTIRGGGLLLLQSVEEVKKKFFSGQDETISTGASSGLFRFTSDDDGENKRQEVDAFLNASECYCHATFVADVEPLKDEADFNRAREAVLAKNRWRQMQMPSMAIPKNTATSPCEIDAVRPRGKSDKGKENKHSPSVTARRDFGKEQKAGDFYKNWANIGGDVFKGLQLSQSFGDIANNREKGNLHNKLAVFYADGNAFGSIQTGCDTAGKLAGFDQTIKGKRRALLTHLFNMANCKPDDSNWVHNDGNIKRLRLETLLWGGDELMLVVPAWQGFRLVNEFFAQTKDWKFGDTQLHHAVGLVFCHHNAPIARIKHLAKDLAELVKDNSDKKNESGFAYLALESFDTVGVDVGTYLDNTLLRHAGADKASWWLSPAMAETWLGTFGGLSENLSKRQVYRAAKALTGAGKEFAEADLSHLLEDDNTESKAQLENLYKSLPENRSKLFPLHLALLWDYLACYADQAQGSTQP